MWPQSPFFPFLAVSKVNMMSGAAAALLKPRGKKCEGEKPA